MAFSRFLLCVSHILLFKEYVKLVLLFQQSALQYFCSSYSFVAHKRALNPV